MAKFFQKTVQFVILSAAGMAGHIKIKDNHIKSCHYARYDILVYELCPTNFNGSKCLFQVKSIKYW